MFNKHIKKNNLTKRAALSSAGVLVYVAFVSQVMINGDRIFGNTPNDFRAPMLFLMLFVFSATICGLLVFGGPIYLFLNGSKKEAVTLLGYTVAGLFVITVLVFVSFALF